MMDPTVADKLFFSYATVATMCEPSYIATKEFIEAFYHVGPPEVLYTYDPLSEALAAEAARLIHADPSEITYIKNTTEGINVASEALPLSRGDEILVQANEYPANLLPWLKKRQDGIITTVIKGKDNPEAFQKLLESIGPKTKAIAISSAQYYDGYMADIATLSEICRRQGIYLVVDAVQTVGTHTIDVTRIPVDILVTGGQKFLRAGVGTGFMYINRDTLSKLRHTKVGIRSMERFTEDEYILKQSAARFQDGTQNLYGIVALLASLQHINKIGINVIEQKNRKLLQVIKACLTERDIPFIDHGKQQSNIVSMPLPDPMGLFNFLKERHIYIRVIKDVARLSFVHDTDPSQVETLADAINEWQKMKA